MENNKKTLVAYFSWGGITKSVAERISKIIVADTFQILPVKEYPKTYALTVVMAGPERLANSRPEIKNKCENFSEYERIIIGFPIWWFSCPKIICTFLESYDFSGKEILAFCTHGGGGAGSSVETINKVLKAEKIKECRDFTKVTDEQIKQAFA